MEDQQDYITEAMKLLQGEPSAEIEAPRIVTERRSGKLVEVEKTAFIKLFTSFKKELKELDGDALKVWIYLALSVNRGTKTANPGLRKIAEETGMAINTVRSRVEMLDKIGLLEAQKGKGIGTEYRPADYVSVSRDDTPTVSKSGAGVSKKELGVSVTRRDFAQLEELELTRKPDILDAEIHFHLQPKALKDAFSKHFKLTPNWEAKYNRQFLEWLVDAKATPEQVERAAKLWGSDRRFNWTVPTLKGIQEHWLELTEQSQKTEEARQQHKSAKPEFDSSGRLINA